MKISQEESNYFYRMSDNVIIKIGRCHQEDTIFFLQIYLDVDCSKITSASPVSASISTAMAAVDADMASAEANRTKEALESWCDSCQNTHKHMSLLFAKLFLFRVLVRFLLRLATREGSLAYSLLGKIDPAKVGMGEIKEAFCRDVDNLDLKPQVCSLLYICSQTRDVTDQVPQQKGR